MLSGSQVTFLLLLYLSEWVRAASVGPSLLHPPVTRVRIIAVADDYDDASSVTTLTPRSPGATTTRAIPRICDYDPCVVQITPCSEISAQTGCLCRGVTGGELRPEAPKLREVKLEHSGQVVVHWCAPRSTVTHYKVTLKGGEERELIFGEYWRNSAVPGMKVGETVCVSAMNDAGVSEETCAQYESPTPDHAALSAGIIAGGVGFLVLITLVAVLLWRRRSCRKANIGEAGGLGNPSYTNDAVL
ncbi:LRRN4 C-terminal-like protein [Triplophysa rosa]|uniref:LRRN4 C-terminal-like protein n=1 Tax=Triplophysa rosa TaxID=992332 RepID=A0A9W7WL35_TRIRA|nr:LRRN4 C-terminal-like protein [Triplophysa rosa]KAI7801498.1 putative LRRN4 C-terminal-like protein [Triplophysa rosa]